MAAKDGPGNPPVDQVAADAVVVGVDGSQDSLRAVLYALREARTWDKDLLIAHAIDDSILAGAWGVTYDPNVLADAGSEVVEQSKAYAIANGMSPDRVRAEVFLGNPAAVLCRLSDRAWTVVVGRRAKGGLERLFVGSTSVGIAGSGQCPVIMISAASNPERTGDKGVIAVGIDNTDRSREALRYACVEAQRRGARVHAVYAFEVSRPFFADDAKVTARAAEQAAAAKSGAEALVGPFQEEFSDVDIQVEIVQAHPVDELSSRTGGVDLLVLGVQGIGMPGMSPGGTVRAVMAHAESPLALVRHAGR